MKNLLLSAIIALFLMPIFCSAQSFGVKLNTPKAIVIQPAKTITADSIYIQQINAHSKGFSVIYSLYLEGKIMEGNLYVILWQGAEHDPNHDYTRQEIKARLKQLLTQ
jgi:hypothetical protein